MDGETTRNSDLLEVGIDEFKKSEPKPKVKSESKDKKKK